MLFFKVMYFCVCWLVCVGGQVWVLVCLFVQCQREVQVGVVPGPAHILHPHSPVSSCTHQSGKTLSPSHRWGRCVSSRWHQMAVTLPWGNHQCLARVLCTSGLPPEINCSLWCKTYSSNTQATCNHPFLSQVLWGGTDGKKNEENDFRSHCRSPCNTPCKMPCSLRCQPVRGREGKARLCPTKRRVG